MQENGEPGEAGMESIDLHELWMIFWRRRWLLALGLAVGCAAAFTISKLQTPVFEAETQILLVDTAAASESQSIAQVLDIQQNAQTYVEWLAQPWFRTEVQRRVGGAIGDGQVEVTSITNSRIIHIAVSDPSPGRAKSVADAFASALIDQITALQRERYASAAAGLDRQIEEVGQQIMELRGRLDQAEAEALEQQLAELRSKLAAAQAILGAVNTERKIETTPTTTGQQNDPALQQRLIDAYEAAYTELQVSGEVKSPPSRITDLQTELGVYQGVYMRLLADRASLRLDRLQDAPDVVQLFSATVSEAPVRPRILVETLGGGLAGLMLAAMALLFIFPSSASATPPPSK